MEILFMAPWILRIDEKISKEGPLYIVADDEKEAKNKDEYKSLVLKHALEKSKVPQNAKKEEYKFDFK